MNWRTDRKVGLGRLLQQLFLIVLLGSLLACGRKGPPVPPESFYPGPVLGLTATGTPEGVALNWVAPSRTQNGRALKDLASFSIRRRVTDSEEDFSELTTIDATATETAATEAKQTAAAAGGAGSYVYVDKTVEPGTTYDYIVVPFNAQHDEGLEGLIVRGAKQEQAG